MRPWENELAFKSLEKEMLSQQVCYLYDDLTLNLDPPLFYYLIDNLINLLNVFSLANKVLVSAL